MRAMKTLAAAAALLAMAGAAQAELHDRGTGMIYDDDLNITWLQDWDYDQSRPYDYKILMDWSTAKTWAEDLVYGGYDDWRLPKVAPVNGSSFQFVFSNNGSTDLGYAKTGAGGGWGEGSEMAHLFYVTLGNKGICEPNDTLPESCTYQLGYGPTNKGPFNKWQPLSGWSSSEYAPDQDYAWVFEAENGVQDIRVKTLTNYAWAVRSGDVAAVPEPQTYEMLLLGITALTVAARRRPR